MGRGGANEEGLDGVAGLLARTMLLLRCFSHDDDTLTARQLIERSGLPRSTVHRLAGHLLRAGLLTRTASGRYAIGPQLWELGHRSHIQVRLREFAQVHLTRLYEICSENVQLAVMTTDDPDTAELLYIGQVMGPRSAAVLSREGVRVPLHTSALGKALLAMQPTPWIDRFLQRPLQRETTHSITSPEVLRAELELARQRGYTTEYEEVTLGSAGIGVAIPSGDDNTPAAIGVEGAVDRWAEHRLAPLVKSAALAIARDMVRSGPGSLRVG